LPSIGGPSIGEYDYLKPVDPATVLDATTETDFKKVWNETITPLYPEWSLDKNPSIVNGIKSYATAEEFKYYIQNKKWPYGSYLTNYATNNKDNVLKGMNKLTVTTTEPVQQIYPTRLFYSDFMMVSESKQSPQQVSVEIFSGKKNTGSTDDKGLSSDNFTKLKSICSSI
jgi:hypothetical protein